MTAPLKPAFFAGNSAMAQRMREFDWARSSLGSLDAWPQSLRTVVNLMLGSGFPMFLTWGPQWVQLYNDAYAEIMGDKHPAGMGQPILENWVEIRDDIKPLIEGALAGDSFYMQDLPLRMQRRGDGAEETWFTFSYSPLQDDDGQVAGMFCACIETTKTVLATRQQRAETEWLKNLFDQAPGFAAVMRGPTHIIEMCNQAYLQLIGFREVLGKPLAEALPDAAAQGFVVLLDQVRATGEPFVGRALRYSRQAVPNEPPVEVFIDFVFAPLVDRTGRVDAIFVQGYDITDQHRAREALREADRHKDEFLATLAHELRNPLAPIRAAVQLLGAAGASENVRLRAADIIGRQVGHMARLLDDLIDIARVTQKRLVMKKETLWVPDLIHAAVEAARPLIEARRHGLTVVNDAPWGVLWADPVRLTQVLSNLLNNAAKYTDPGGQVRLDTREEGGMLVIGVQDDGIGLSQRAISTIFEMFAQEQTALDRAEGGLGIGLALSKGLVEMHDGSVSASSAGPGQGSRFEVRLPLAETVIPQSPAAGNGASVVSGMLTRCVLLADDNRDAADTLAELLRMDGHTVHTAHDGLDAIAKAMILRPDVLVLDIGMPGLNGYEVARRLRAERWERRPYLIAATGWGRDNDRQAASDAGFDTHLTKPFDPLHLAMLVGQHRPD